MNKKKIIKIGIPVAAGCIVLALGIGFAVKNSGKAVKVAPVSSLNSGGWYDDSGIASYGTVTTNQKQDIYVDADHTGLRESRGYGESWRPSCGI